MTEAQKAAINSYYFNLESTGNEAIDNILRWLARAGTAYHHTEWWDDEFTENGITYVAEIQKAANNAAQSIQQAIDNENHELRKQKDQAYSERNKLVNFLSYIYPSHIRRHPDEDADWEDDWRYIVCIHGPMGQMTWHIHDSELWQFQHIHPQDPAFDDCEWDGHTTEEKYRRLQLAQGVAAVAFRCGREAQDKELKYCERIRKLRYLLKEALRSLARWYYASNREGWEDGESEQEAKDHVCDTLANALDPKWPSGYTLASTIARIDKALEG